MFMSFHLRISSVIKQLNLIMDVRKTRRRTCSKSVKHYFQEYCNTTSIHGFRYFGENRTYFERCWWFIVFVLVLTACTIAIKEVYCKWLRSPVIVSFATKETPIFSIPFPAVTICPESKSLQMEYNHTKMIRKQIEKVPFTDREKFLVDYMGLLCDESSVELNNSGFKIIENPEEFYNTIEAIKPQDALIYCEYMGYEEDCNKLFKPILTDEGICYTFNMLDRSEIFSDDVYYPLEYFVAANASSNNWSVDDGYAEDAGLETYPKRALAGARNALIVHVHTEKEEIDFNCKRGLQGFRVSLHTPMRVPTPSQHYFMVPLDEAVLAVVKPIMMTTAASVKVFHPSKRECYFPNEKKLKYFKIYTALNCKLECLSNYTQHYCNCVPYYMPRHSNMSICGMGSLQCMKESERIMEIVELYMKLKGDTIEVVNDSGECDCKPLCSDLSYDVETSQGAWDWYEELRTYNSSEQEFDLHKNEHHLSRLVIFFKSSHFITSQRHELYGPTDFLANFGGLLGLFTGISVLSLMEMIYFLTVRMCCNTRLYGYWAGPQSVTDKIPLE